MAALLLIQNFFQPINRSRMQPRRPTFALPNLGARFFQRLRLEVVPLQKLSFLLRQLLDRGPYPRLHLLELQPFIGRQLFI
jgi:hypothetical protein